MRERLAIIGLMVLFLPVYGQEKTARPKGDQTHAKQDVGPSIPGSVVVNCGESNLVREHDAAKESDGVNNKPQSYFKTLFSANNLPNDCLFLIGLAGVCIATWTLLTIKRQVDTFISKERARITVEIEPFNPSPANPAGILYDRSPAPPARFKICHIDLRIANSGETNAFIRAAFCKACIKELRWNARNENIASQIDLPKVMHPHQDAFRHSSKIETGHVLESEVDGKTAQAIAEGTLGVYVIGHIEFGDVFDNRWTVRICRKWGAWMFGGEWQNTSSWYDYEPQTRGEFPMNGEFRIKQPSMLRRILRRMRKSDPQAPVIEIT